MTKFAQFIRDEDGAVTIDWVALTAGILLLGIAVVYTIFENGVSGVVEQINTQLSSATTVTGLNTTFDQGSLLE
jgi:Flp pilus assembly pilin Flp